MLAVCGMVWIFSRITNYFQEIFSQRTTAYTGKCVGTFKNHLHLASMEVCISSLLSVATALSKYQL